MVRAVNTGRAMLLRFDSLNGVRLDVLPQDGASAGSFSVYQPTYFPARSAFRKLQPRYSAIQMRTAFSWGFFMNRDSRPGVCIIVENQPVPFDRRVWQEAQALLAAGYRVSIISPKGPGCEAKFGRRGLIYKMVCLAERLTFRAADLSIATNESYQQIAIERGGMKPENVLVVQTCADLSEVSRGQPKPELKGGRRHMVLFVGVMERQDGLRLLVESIEYLVKHKRREDTRFVLIGSGTELPILKTLATQSGVDDFVEFTGLLPHEQVGPYLSTADVCVAPDPLNSLNNKSTMIKIFEYMAYSRPVVLYELEEGRRVAGDSALYARPNDPIDFANQIEKLLESEELRKKLGESGRKRTEEGLNWKVQSAKLVAAYAGVLAADDLAPN